MSLLWHSVPHYLLIPLDYSHLHCTHSPLYIREDEQVTRAAAQSFSPYAKPIHNVLSFHAQYPLDVCLPATNWLKKISENLQEHSWLHMGFSFLSPYSNAFQVQQSRALQDCQEVLMGCSGSVIQHWLANYHSPLSLHQLAAWDNWDSTGASVLKAAHTDEEPRRAAKAAAHPPDQHCSPGHAVWPSAFKRGAVLSPQQLAL